MALYNALDRGKHLEEFTDPLVTNEGVLAASTRQARAVANLGISAVAAEIDYLDLTTGAGTGEASKALVLDSALELDWTVPYTTSGNKEALNLDVTMAGAGATGGRAKFTMTATAALGAWSNALKAQVDYGTGGSTSGLGSAFVAELVMGPDTDTGTYAPLEVEFGFPDGSVLGTAAAFVNLTAYGDTEELAAFNDAGFLFDIQGITAGSGDMLQASAVADINSTHALKIRIGATTYYIPLHTAANFGG